MNILRTYLLMLAAPIVLILALGNAAAAASSSTAAQEPLVIGQQIDRASVQAAPVVVGDELPEFCFACSSTHCDGHSGFDTSSSVDLVVIFSSEDSLLHQRDVHAVAPRAPPQASFPITASFDSRGPPSHV